MWEAGEPPRVSSSLNQIGLWLRADRSHAPKSSTGAFEKGSRWPVPCSVAFLLPMTDAPDLLLGAEFPRGKRARQWLKLVQGACSGGAAVRPARWLGGPMTAWRSKPLAPRAGPPLPWSTQRSKATGPVDGADRTIPIRPPAQCAGAGTTSKMVRPGLMAGLRRLARSLRLRPRSRRRARFERVLEGVGHLDAGIAIEFRSEPADEGHAAGSSRRLVRSRGLAPGCR